jgi:hypothetical protein
MALLGALLGCRSPQAARLATEMAGAATGTPLIFHGNCFAGWEVTVELRVRETGGAAVWLGELSYRLSDEGLGATLAEDTLDAATLEARYGASTIPAHGERLFPLGGPSGGRPVGPIALDGVLRGRQGEGGAVFEEFRLTAPSLVLEDPEPGSGGACAGGATSRGSGRARDRE